MGANRKVLAEKFPLYIPAAEWARMHGIKVHRIRWHLENGIAPYKHIGRWYLVAITALPAYKVVERPRKPKGVTDGNHPDPCDSGESSS